MKKKIVLSSLVFCLCNPLNASFFSSDVDNNYREFKNEVMSLFKDDIFFLKPMLKTKLSFSGFSPKLNQFIDKKEYTFEFELAGINKDDINVSISDENILKVSAIKNKLSEKKQKELVSSESFYGKFSRSISLQKDIDKENIDITYKNGILKIIIPRDSKKLEEKVKFLKIK